VLLSLLVLPLYIPALVFGSGAVEAQMVGMGYGAQMSILTAMLVVAAFFGPWACALALRIALE
jgi:heme exporter protein B